MSRRFKSLPSPSEIERNYPFEVAVLACEVSRRYDEIASLAKVHGSYVYNHSIFVSDEWFVVYCFPTFEGAECFLRAFDGEWITAKERKKRLWRTKYVRMLVGEYRVEETS